MKMGPNVKSQKSQRILNGFQTLQNHIKHADRRRQLSSCSNSHQVLAEQKQKNAKINDDQSNQKKSIIDPAIADLNAIEEYFALPVKEVNGSNTTRRRHNGARGKSHKISRVEQLDRKLQVQQVTVPRRRMAITVKNGRALNIKNDHSSEISQMYPQISMSHLVALNSAVRLWRLSKKRKQAKKSMQRSNCGGEKDREKIVHRVVDKFRVSKIPSLLFFNPESEQEVDVGSCYDLDLRGYKHRRNFLQKNITAAEDCSTIVESLKVSGQKDYLSNRMETRVSEQRIKISNLSTSFHTKQKSLAREFSSELEIHDAENTKLFKKKLATFCNNSSSLPVHKIEQEVDLLQLKCRKERLLQRCQTLEVFGKLMYFIEHSKSNLEKGASVHEILFLTLFREFVEKDRILTTVLFDQLKERLRSKKIINCKEVKALLGIIKRYVDSL